MTGMTAAVDSIDDVSPRRRRRSPQSPLPESTKQDWLTVFAPSGNVTAACDIIGISRQQIYDWRNEDAAFAAAMDEVRERAVDELEEIAFDRARRSSDFLLWKLLSSHRRDTYGAEVRHKHTVEREQRVAVLVATMGCTRDEALQAIELAERALASGAVVEGSAEVRQ